MKQAWKIVLKVIRILLGTILVLVGLAGLTLPFLPGWIFIIPGVLILAKDVPFIRRFVHWIMDSRPVHWLEHRFPQTHASLHKLREQMKARHQTRRERRQQRRAQRRAAAATRCRPGAKPIEGRSEVA